MNNRSLPTMSQLLTRRLVPILVRTEDIPVMKDVDIYLAGNYSIERKEVLVKYTNEKFSLLPISYNFKFKIFLHFLHISVLRKLSLYTCDICCRSF